VLRGGGENRIPLDRPIGDEPQDAVAVGDGACRRLGTAAHLDLHARWRVRQYQRSTANITTAAWGSHRSSCEPHAAVVLVRGPFARRFSTAVARRSDEYRGTIDWPIRSKEVIPVRLALRHRIVLTSRGLHCTPNRGPVRPYLRPNSRQTKRREQYEAPEPCVRVRSLHGERACLRIS
jgi:hypothetical protein